MRKKSKILTKAGVLLIAVFMVITTIPAAVADATTAEDAIQGNFMKAGHRSIPNVPILHKSAQLDRTEAFDGSFDLGTDEWYYVHNGASHDPGLASDSIGLTGAGMMYGGFVLDLSGEIGNEITKVSYCDYGDGSGAGLAGTARIWEGDLGGTLGPEVASESFTTTDSGDFEDIILSTPVEITVGTYSITFEAEQTAGSQYFFAVDSGPSAPGGDWISLDGTTWDDMGDAYGFDYNWLFEAYVAGGGGGPVGDCLEDQCDFAIDGFTDEFEQMRKEVDINNDGITDYWAFNSEPHELCIDIANLGDVGIGELKLLADVYEKVCGPTITIWDDPKYDLQQFPCCGDNYPFYFPGPGYTPMGDEPIDPEDRWYVEDDGDMDSWALQGGQENRWLTNNQAWRNTKGEDRSFGVDEDVYLGLADYVEEGVYDNLTSPTFDLSGAACAEISFSHWAEGEYTINDNGAIVPVDFGSIAYTLDGGATWTEVGYAAGDQQFVAYDTNGEWEDVTIKIINTEIDADDLDYMHPYNMVCDDCEPEEGEIVIMDDLTDADFQIKFIWHKDPCLQYEGWYIDNLKVQKTLDYELELTCQTHEIIELDPCDPEVGPEWIDYCFPLDCEFEDDTWYEVHIVGQVFEPSGCEQIIENNEFKFQFKIEDIHDLRCVNMSFSDLDDSVRERSIVIEPGESESAPVTAWVENVGTFAEPKENIDVSLMKGDIVVNELVNDRFEVDSLGDYSAYYFNFDEGPSLIPWRWSKGDGSISNIYESDPNQARSRNPGSECLVGAQEGSFPVLLEDTVSVIAPSNVIDLDPNNNWVESGFEADCDDPCDAEMSFEMKWSLEIGEDTYYGGYYPGTAGSMVYLAIMPSEGPGAGYVYGQTIPEVLADLAVDGYENDWVSIDLSYDDLVGMIEDVIVDPFIDPVTGEAFYYEGLPACEIGLMVYAEGAITEANMNWMPAAPNGGTYNPFNPIPWTGILVDNWYFSVNDIGETVEVASGTISEDELLPGQMGKVEFAWNDVELCQHGLEVDVNLEGDMNPGNDRCCMLRVTAHNEEYCFDSYIEDLTGGGECHWHACTNRENGDDYFAWAGVESEHSAQYINNMDEGLVSPDVDLSDVWDQCDLFALNFTTYYDFANSGDFVEVDIWKTFDHDADPETANITKWVQIGKLTGDSNGVFEDKALTFGKDMQNTRTKIRFRMVSDDDLVAEGCYIDDVRIVNVSAAASLSDVYLGYTDYTDNALAWTDGSAWTEAIELSSPEIDAYVGNTLDEIEVSVGCDVYGFYAEDFTVYAANALPDMASPPPVLYDGTSVATGWTEATLTTPYTVTNPTYLIVEFDAGYAGYPAGFDTTVTTEPRGQHMLDHGTTNTWTTVGALGYPSVWGINAGISAGSSNLEFHEDLPVLTWMDDDFPPEFPYENTEGIGSNYPLWDTFERGTVEPWSCIPGSAGNWWMNTENEETLPNDAEDIAHDECDPCNIGFYTIPSENLVPYGYPATGTGINNAIAFVLDLTDETLNQNFVEFCAAINYELSQEKAFIEFSPDWEPGTPMESATWVEYWVHTPGDSYGDDTGGWIYLEDLTSFDDDPRWLIDEYIGSKVAVRFRLETAGNGAGIGMGFAIDDVHLKVKYTGEAFVDEVPPQTSIFFNQQTGGVLLTAVDFPEGKASGVAATYYKIDGGEQQQGKEFTLPEGTHTVEYWSVDNNGNEESHKTSPQYVVDTTNPTVEITSPEEGGIYLLGNKLLSLGSSTISIGKVMIEADADDGDGSGIDYVRFKIEGAATDSGFDNSDPYDYLFKKMCFGSITVTATAVDMGGRTGSDEISLKCFSLGLL